MHSQSRGTSALHVALLSDLYEHAPIKKLNNSTKLTTPIYQLLTNVWVYNKHLAINVKGNYYYVKEDFFLIQINSQKLCCIAKFLQENVLRISFRWVLYSS